MANTCLQWAKSHSRYWNILIYLILTTNLSGRYYYTLRLTNEKTEAQKRSIYLHCCHRITIFIDRTQQRKLQLTLAITFNDYTLIWPLGLYTWVWLFSIRLPSSERWVKLYIMRKWQLRWIWDRVSRFSKNLRYPVKFKFQINYMFLYHKWLPDITLWKFIMLKIFHCLSKI